MSAAETLETPWHLRGNLAPVFDEIDAFDLPVDGAIPRELRGRYLRNGPNPKSGTSPHWFLGNGMIHGVRIEGGRAVWYRNRYVRTPLLERPDTPMLDDSGRAVVFSTLLLAAGFWVGLFAAFRPSVHFALLTGAALLLGLVSEAVLLPLTLIVFKPFGPPRGRSG